MALGCAEICLADSTADYFHKEVRACVCLPAVVTVCAFFFSLLFRFVCFCLFPVCDCVYLDKDLPSFHTLFIWDDGFLLFLSGHRVPFCTRTFYLFAADNAVTVQRWSLVLLSFWALTICRLSPACLFIAALIRSDLFWLPVMTTEFKALWLSQDGMFLWPTIKCRQAMRSRRLSGFIKCLFSFCEFIQWKLCVCSFLSILKF